MANITTRSTSGGGATVKGSPLTNAEIDQNFININVDLGNAAYVTGSYSNPSWINSLSETKVLPSQTGQSGKFLTTNGTVTSWGDVPLPAGQTAGSTTVGFLQYSGNTVTNGQLNSSTTAPSSTTRLNYEGYLYATRFYGDGSNLTNLPLPSGLTSGSTSNGYLQYSGTIATAGQINGGTTAPTGTIRLNYEGNFYATRFYGDGSNLVNLPKDAGSIYLSQNFGGF